MKVVILAGGFGTRIAEESCSKPKPMIEIGGGDNAVKSFREKNLTDGSPINYRTRAKAENWRRG